MDLDDREDDMSKADEVATVLKSRRDMDSRVF